MEFICCFTLIGLMSLLLGDGLNIYLALSIWLWADWLIGKASPLFLIPASIFAIAGAIAGNGKRQVEFEKKKLTQGS